MTNWSWLKLRITRKHCHQITLVTLVMKFEVYHSKVNTILIYLPNTEQANTSTVVAIVVHQRKSSDTKNSTRRMPSQSYPLLPEAETTTTTRRQPSVHTSALNDNYQISKVWACNVVRRRQGATTPLSIPTKNTAPHQQQYNSKAPRHQQQYTLGAPPGPPRRYTSTIRRGEIYLLPSPRHHLMASAHHYQPLVGICARNSKALHQQQYLGNNKADVDSTIPPTRSLADESITTIHHRSWMVRSWMLLPSTARVRCVKLHEADQTLMILSPEKTTTRLFEAEPFLLRVETTELRVVSAAMATATAAAILGDVCHRAWEDSSPTPDPN